MGTLPHIFLFRMFFLGHWAWQSAAQRPSISQKDHVVPELLGLRHFHRSGSAIHMWQLWGAAPPTLGGSALLPWPRALGTFHAGQLGTKVKTSQAQGGAVASNIGLKVLEYINFKSRASNRAQIFSEDLPPGSRGPCPGGVCLPEVEGLLFTSKGGSG